MNDGYSIGLTGQFGGGYLHSGGLPFGRGFAGAAKRIERVKSSIADFLFNFEGASQVVASFHEGVVSLTGHVPSEDDRRFIEQSVRKIPGVTDVRMALQIETPAKASSSRSAAASSVDSTL